MHRPLFWIDEGLPPATEAADRLLQTVTEHPDSEIVLLTFVDPNDRVDDIRAFERFVAQVREAYMALEGPVFFTVGFHRRSGEDGPEKLTKDSLVPLIRRSPDPVIQCVNAEVLERARRQAQAAAHKRLVETLGAKDPMLRAMIERSIQADSELSSDIAKHNFTSVGDGAGRARFETAIADILRDRDESYGAA